jgi:CYTH domain-containing protein
VSVPLKYAVVERERRFLVRGVPDGVVRTDDLLDKYLDGTRLRLREVRSQDGGVVRKLGHKVRLGDDAAAVACTSLYLDDAEWLLLSGLPGVVVRKRRHHVQRAGVHVAVDELEDGTLLAEIDDRDDAPVRVPDWLEVLADVSTDEAWTGAAIAARLGRQGYGDRPTSIARSCHHESRPGRPS